CARPLTGFYAMDYW
nr:immunoglobulin heavy chain junction region [Mus musculus]